MNKVFRRILLFLLLILVPISVKADTKYNIYLFYGQTCPHCAEEEEFLESYLGVYDNVELVKYEVWNSKDNRDLLVKVQEELNNHTSGVPYLVIGEKVIVGYLDGTTDKQIKKEVEKYVSTKKPVDVMEYINEGNHIEKPKEKPKENKEFTLPILGKVNAKNISLPLLAVVLGLVDGFNPCAMWILIFLISMLIGLKDKKKLILYGSVFLITSGLVYFALMFTWLSVIAKVSVSLVFRIIIAVFALGAGIYNLYSYIKSLKKDDGCTVTNTKQRKTIMTKIKKFTQEKNVIIAILGIIVLAIGVNFIELLCSAGLPALFTEILAINKVSMGMGIVYNLIYIIFFMLDDFIIFMIAVTTMNIKVISTKYSKYSHLIAGIIMLIIGILLILKPEWVMFNF